MYEIKDLARNALRNYLVPTLQRSNAGNTEILITPAISVCHFRPTEPLAGTRCLCLYIESVAYKQDSARRLLRTGKHASLISFDKRRQSLLLFVWVPLLSF